MEKVRGSGKPPVNIVASSSASTDALDLAKSRPAEGVGVAVEIETRDLHELDARLELGIGLARKDRHAVAEAGKRRGEVPDVDALASAVGIAAVDDERDSERRRTRSAHPQCRSTTAPAATASGGLGHFGWNPSAIDL